MKYVIAGNGPAGTNAAEKIRAIDPEGKIIMVADEANLPYSRIMVPEYMTGEVTHDQLFIRKPDFYERLNIETRLGCKLQQVNQEQKQVRLDNGEVLDYDRLLIATGSSSAVPKFLQTDARGVFSLWNKSDAEAIKSFLPHVKKAVIIGGGLVGLQAARSLHSAGVEITMIEMADRLMPTQFDQAAGQLLRSAMETQGVSVCLETKVNSLSISENQVRGVETSQGFMAADMVLVAVGVKPNLEFLQDTGIQMNRGVIADIHMQSSIPDLYVAGDVAETPCLISGELSHRALWLHAVQQGKVAGANMAGVPQKYFGSHGMNSIQLFGLSIVSLGQLTTGEGIEEVIVTPPASGRYQKLLLKNDVLVGLIFVGDVQESGILYQKLGHPLTEGYMSKAMAQAAGQITL